MMSESKHQIKQLILSYEKRVRVAIKMLNEKLKEDNMYPMVYREEVRALQNGIKYRFHGSGCSVYFNDNITVDFDFPVNPYGIELIPNSLDFFLQQQRHNYSLILNQMSIETLLRELEKDNEVIWIDNPDYARQFYILASNYTNPKPIEFLAYKIHETMLEEDFIRLLKERLKRK